jgi:hypothetical protein
VEERPAFAVQSFFPSHANVGLRHGIPWSSEIAFAVAEGQDARHERNFIRGDLPWPPRNEKSPMEAYEGQHERNFIDERAYDARLERNLIAPRPS